MINKNKYKIKINNIDENFYYTKDFNLCVARYLLELAALSYNKDKIDTENETKKINHLKLVKIVENENAKALIFFHEKENIIIVSFTGTELNDINDFITDLEFWNSKTTELKGKTHFGFYEYYKKIKFPVLKEILKLDKNREKNIYWTGHSLGGAIAILFCVVYNKGVVYTFGQPKVGNKTFARYCDKNIILYRIRTPLDIIPLLPPSIFFSNYKHSNKEFIFNYDVKYINFKNKILSNSFFSNLILKIFFSFHVFKKILKKNFLFHSVNAYRKVLNKEFFKIKNTD